MKDKIFSPTDDDPPCYVQGPNWIKIKLDLPNSYMKIKLEFVPYIRSTYKNLLKFLKNIEKWPS